MADRVVIGDLGEYRGDDCLKFDGVNDSCSLDTDIPLSIGDTVIVDVYAKFVPVTGSKMFDSKGDVNRFDINITAVGVLDLRTYCTFKVNGVASNIIPEEEWCSVEITVTEAGHSLGSIGMRYSLSNFFNGQMKSISINGECVYICSGDYGNTELVSRGGFPSGTINGATWWKKGVAENYLTTTAYLSARPAIQEVDQEIIVVDESQYYPTSDPIWTPYNTDPTYSFKVQLQGTEGSLGVVGLNKLDINFSLTF